ncbi:MAG TPA: LpqB family beta-propeller domain-containing protein [Streptosporangiaceae bacterium]|nr:LpqB family beta-propeller domain-containing protein [Streptosporangiaceae bacterium]
MRNRLRLAGSVLVLSVAVTACANLPTSGTVQIGSLQGSGDLAQPGVQVVPVPPGRTWDQIDIVNGFLAASASFDDNYAVARKYLTPGLSRWWRPGVAATVIDSPQVSPEQPPRGLVTSGPPSARVSVTGRHFAELQTGGPHQAGSIVASPGSSTYHFSLVQKAGVWRIDGITIGNEPAKPSLLVLTSTDFERDYQARNLYFYRPGPAANTLVPDPVYVPQLPGNGGLKILVNTLLQPRAATTGSWPPASSWLYEAATTAFPGGTELISADIIGGIKAVVKLGGTAVRSSPSQRLRMAAQLWWSLTYSPYGTQAGSQIRSVVLKVGHQSLQPTPAEFTKWVPRAVAAPLYYQLPGGPAGPAAAILRASPSQQVSVSLPKALGGEPFTAMAVSTPPTGFAVLAGCRGKDVYLMPQSHAGEIVTKRLPAGECTSLSWDNFGNLWVAATKGVYEISALPSAGLITIQIPPLPPTAVFQSVRVAPDGVRVAMIVRYGSSTRILIAAISKNPSFTYLAQTQQMLRVGSDVMNPVALTWLDPDHLLVLDRTAGKTEIYQVPLSSGASTEIATPRGVTSLAASWPYGQLYPQVVVGIAPTRTTPGQIEMSKTSPLNPDWQPVVKGITPVFPG